MKYERFEEPIEIPQFFYTRDMHDYCFEILQTAEERGQFFTLLTTWALDNILDEEYAKQCSPEVIEAFNKAVMLMFSGINKYRWDYYNGRKGGRPRNNIPQLGM